MFFMSDAGVWLEKKYLEWQLGEGGRRPLEEFATVMGKSRSYISLVMNGDRKPGEQTAREWAEITGDNEILDLLGFAREDPLMSELQGIYDLVPDEDKEEFVGLVRELSNRGYELVRAVHNEDVVKREGDGRDRTTFCRGYCAAIAAVIR